jgi:hypothetical protein
MLKKKKRKEKKIKKTCVFSPFSSPPTPYAVADSLQATYRNEDEEEDESAPYAVAVSGTVCV